MIEIEYNLMLAERMGKGLQTLDIGDSLHLSQLETKLGLTDDDVGMVLINGVWSPLDSLIKDGDFVQLYPDLEGG
jgi:hypothetical protein